MVLFVAIFAHHRISRFALEHGAGTALHARIRIADFRLTARRLVLESPRVETAAGDPLFAASRVTVDFDPAEVLRSHAHRYGVLALSAVDPVVTIVRHADGRYGLPSIGGAPGGGTQARLAPWNLSLSVRGGTLRLIDRAPLASDLAEQQIGALSLAGRLDSSGVTQLIGSAVALERPQPGAAPAGFPLTIAARGDAARGLASVRVHAAALALRGPLAFIEHSPAVELEAGIAHDFTLRAFSLDYGLSRPADWHVGGTARATGGRLRFAALRVPVLDARGPLTLTDDGVWTSGLDGTLAGVPLHARGGIYDRLAPTLRLGIRARGDVGQLRTIFAFSARQPVRGLTDVQTLIENTAADVMIRTALEAPRVHYGAVPLDDVRGRVDFHAGTVVLDGLTGRLGPAAIDAGGRVVLGGTIPDSRIAAVATGPGRAIPYAENIAPDASVSLAALIAGSSAGYRAAGTLDARGPGIRARGRFRLDEDGRGAYGPIVVERADGSWLSAGIALDRPTSASAAWVAAHGFRVALPPVAARLPGLELPAFPAVGGRLDVALVGGGRPDGFALEGPLSGTHVRAGTLALGRARAELGGRLGDVRLARVVTDGPLGRFAGTAAAGGGLVAVRGAYDGSLQRLRPLTRIADAGGAVHGDLAAAVGGPTIVVQSTSAKLAGATVRGVRVDGASGTLRVGADGVRVVAARAAIGAAAAVGRDAAGRIALSAPDLPAPALRGTGLPLVAGRVSVFGDADLRGRDPRFDGYVLLRGGRADGIAVAGDGRVALAGGRARIGATTGALGATFGSLSGAIDGVGHGALRYDLRARVPLGDVATLRRDLALGDARASGSFAAGLRVRGTGNRPSAAGRIDVPEATIDGLALAGGHALVDVQTDRLALHDAAAMVGTSRVSLDATIAGHAYDVRLAAPALDLADFDDLFDESDLIGGRGSGRLALRFAGGRITTSGDVRLRGLRVRGRGFGDAAGSWRMDGTSIVARGRLADAGARLSALGRIDPAVAASPLDGLLGAHGRVDTRFSGLDVAALLPVTGRSLPLTGTLGGTLSASGVLRHPIVDVDARLHDAVVAGYAVADAAVAARFAGTRGTIRRATADLGVATLAASGRIGLLPGDPLGLRLLARTPDVSRAAAVLAHVPGLPASGAVDADVTVGGTVAHPSLDGRIGLTGGRVRGLAIPSASADVRAAGSRVTIRHAEVQLARGSASIGGSVPIRRDPWAVDPDAPLDLRLAADGVDLAPFGAIVPGGAAVTGTLDGHVAIAGSLRHPLATGEASLLGGSFRSAFVRTPLRRIAARLHFDGERVYLQAFHAGVGSGSLDAAGDIGLTPADSVGAYALAMRARGAQLDLAGYGRGTLDGALRLTGGGAARPLLAGALTLRDADVAVSALFGGGTAGSGGLPVAAAFDPRLDIAATLGRDVRLRSSIVDVGVDGKVAVAGSLGGPRLAGVVKATDGTISSYNHLFSIAAATATFTPADGIVPTIRARATARVVDPDPDPSRNIAGSATISVNVDGTPDNNLQVTYSSDPPYSQEQIVGLLLDVPALLGSVKFDLNGGSGTEPLRGAPGATNALLPPGVTPEQVSPVSLNEEVFSLLNGQIAQRAISPATRVFERVFGLSDFEVTADYGGGLGYAVRRPIGAHDLSAFVSQTVTYPNRTNAGLELDPKPFESVNLSLYQQNGITSLVTNATPGYPFATGTTRRIEGLKPLGDRHGFSLDFRRRF